MKIEVTRPVGEIVNEMEASIPVFEKMHIDYSFGGNRTLKDACYLAGAPLDQVVVLLEKVSENRRERADTKDWRHESLESLIDYIVERHHLYTWSHLAYLKNLAEKVSLDQGTEHPELVELHWAIKNAAKEIEAHLTKEEELVFPRIRAMARAKEEGKVLDEDENKFVPEQRPLQVLTWEHGMISNDWDDIRAITHNYHVPPDASAAVKELYRGLAELELDLHQHTHLENNILFKRALEMGLID